MATYYQGIQGTGDINQTRVVDDIVEQIMMKDADRTPFQILLQKMGKESAHNYKFTWQEDAYMDYRTTTTGDDSGTAGSDTDLPVSDVEMFLEGDLVLCAETGEIMKVTNVDVTNDEIDVTRGYIGDAGDLDSNDELIIIADANMQGAGTRDINNRQVDTPYNYTHIIKTGLGMTRTQMNTKTHGAKEWGRIVRKKAIEHKEKIERALLFSERNKDTSGTDVETTTRGVLNWISSNVENVGSDLTETEFDAFLADHAFAHGSDRKLLLASRDLISEINSWAKDSIQTKVGDDTYGIKVMEYQSAFGVLDIVEHKFLQGDTYGYYGIALDMDKIKYRYLENSDTKLKDNVQDPGTDGRQAEYLSEVGLQFGQEECHAVIKNFSG